LNTKTKYAIILDCRKVPTLPVHGNFTNYSKIIDETDKKETYTTLIFKTGGKPIVTAQSISGRGPDAAVRGPCCGSEYL
jgi:hypothetical protein